MIDGLNGVDATKNEKTGSGEVSTVDSLRSFAIKGIKKLSGSCRENEVKSIFVCA